MRGGQGSVSQQRSAPLGAGRGPQRAPAPAEGIAQSPLGMCCAGHSRGHAGWLLLLPEQRSAAGAGALLPSPLPSPAWLRSLCLCTLLCRFPLTLPLGHVAPLSSLPCHYRDK